MTNQPSTDFDPQPGDFDAFLEQIDPADVQVHEGNPDARLTIVLNVHGEDARRLQRIAERRSQGIEQVVADLLRDADQHAA